MDRRKIILNVTISIGFKLLLLFISLLLRRVLIQTVGNEANGVISLFASIIGVLSIADLGIGTAITFCMYKPIVENDQRKVAALFNLFKKIYFYIGIILFIAGLVVLPFMNILAKDYQLEYSIHLLFILRLISVVISYISAAKLSLINAHKNNYITMSITSIVMILNEMFQILVLIFLKSLYLYFICSIVAELIQYIIFRVYTNKKYSHLINTTETVDLETKRELVKNVRALIFHKIGALFVNSIDSLIISAFFGVIVLGKYSNYILIINSMLNIATLFFTQITSIVGQAFYKTNKILFKKYFYMMYFLNFFIGTALFLSFYKCANPFINIIFGKNLLLEDSILIVITMNYFIQFMLQTVRLFKDSTGLFYYDRYKCLFEAALNLALSLILVNVVGFIGVIVSTIITNLVICHIVEPYVLYKHAFKNKVSNYYFINYFSIICFCVLLFCFRMINLNNFSDGLQFVLGGIIGVSMSLPVAIPALILFIRIKNHNKYVLKGEQNGS